MKPLRRRLRALRGRRRLRLARPRRQLPARPGLRRRRPRPQARHVLRRSAHARLAGPRAGGRGRPAAARRADQPPRHRVAGVAGADARLAWTARSSSSPTTAGSWRRSARRCWSSRPGARATSRAPGTTGARSRPRASWRWARRSRSSRPRSRAWRRSSSASARRRPRRARPSRGSRRSTRSSGSTRDPRDTRELGFQFAKPERTGRVIFELEDGRLEVGDEPKRKLLLDDAELWLERGEHVSLVGPNGTGKTTLIEALAGQRPLDGGKLRTGHNLKVGYLSQHDSELEGWAARGPSLEAAVKRTGPDAQPGALAARAVPVQRRGRREAARRPQRRRAQAAGAGDPAARRAPTS